MGVAKLKAGDGAGTFGERLRGTYLRSAGIVNGKLRGAAAHPGQAQLIPSVRTYGGHAASGSLQAEGDYGSVGKQNDV